MKWVVVTVGKPALAFARAGRDEYLARIARYAPVRHVTVKASDPKSEGAALLEKSEGCYRVLLDEKGRQMASRTLATEMDAWRARGKDVALLIGGADGHATSVREAADLIWSLGPLTLQHELALVVALEQIYRAQTILAGHPYHRD